MQFKNTQLSDLKPNDLCFDERTWFWIDTDTKTARALFNSGVGAIIDEKNIKRVLTESVSDREVVSAFVKSALCERGA